MLDEGAYVDASGDVIVSQTEELEWTMRLQEISEWQQLLGASTLGDACAAFWRHAAHMYPPLSPARPYRLTVLNLISAFFSLQLRALHNFCAVCRRLRRHRGNRPRFCGLFATQNML